MRTLIAKALRKAAHAIGPDSEPIDITDHYVKWLCYANAGMLNRGNLYLMDYALQRIPSQAPIIEIGSFCGLSANLLTYYKKKYALTNKLITCDKWEFEVPKGEPSDYVAGSSVRFTEYMALVKNSFLRNTQTFSADDLPFTIEAFSQEFFSFWRKNMPVHDVFGRPIALGGPISFCYIDGNHSYEGVKFDFQNCDEFLEVGGFILFDDSFAKDFGVYKLMPEIKGMDRYQLAAKNPNHLFQKIRK